APAAGTPKIVRFLADSWAVNEVPIDRQASLFNEKSRPNVEVRVEIKGDGWDTKLLSQIKSGTLQWSGSMVMTAPTELAKQVLSGMIAPMDDYLKQSKEQGAAQIQSDMIPSVLKNSTYQGHVYGIPYSFENNSYIYRKDFYSQVGVAEQPATWDELFETSMKIKKDGKLDQVTPFAFVQDLDATVATLMNSATDNPYTQDGIYDLTSDAGIASMEFMQKLVANDLVPPHTWDDWWPLAQKSKLAALFGQSSRGTWIGKIYGMNSVVTTGIPLKTKGGLSNGSYFWNNNTTILNKAPYPQETADFIVFAFGPQNKSMQDAIITSGKTPIYESIYQTMIEGDKNYADYAWMVPMRKQVEANHPIPPTLLWRIQKDTFMKYAVKFLEKGTTMTPKQFGDQVMKETLDQGAKLKADLGVQ
ncbi:MAG TPA: extracellular solute-binding protein, partial [Chloroflexota bacterium]|nr:extracellular solute-binding protein [Chloroflexota bacterium]